MAANGSLIRINSHFFLIVFSKTGFYFAGKTGEWSHEICKLAEKGALVSL